MGKYDPLFSYLRNLEDTSIELTFREVENILGQSLPESAFVHRPWWSNDKSHAQASAWLDAGWKVDSVDLGLKKVVFRNESSVEGSTKTSASRETKKGKIEEVRTDYPKRSQDEVGLVSCTNAKRRSLSKPKDLYMESFLFRKVSRYCEKYHGDWYIISAKYYVLDPEGPEIEPYDETLNNANKQKKLEWSRRVFEQLRDRGLLSKKLVIHAGKDYYQHLLPLLEGFGVDYEIPTQGLRIGEKMRWYSSRI